LFKKDFQEFWTSTVFEIAIEVLGDLHVLWFFRGLRHMINQSMVFSEYLRLESIRNSKGRVSLGGRVLKI
jgi:hypothetical protein